MLCLLAFMFQSCIPKHLHVRLKETSKM
uniref:Uncharacterized protein n=1 Tax=Anguilla anguilla TaxID=7936 RepID=A0A0E9SK77_ANGAN